MSAKGKQDPNAKEPSSKPSVTPTKPDDMSSEELEFITAIDEYKRIHQRKFPNWSEVLGILKSLGYAKGA